LKILKHTENYDVVHISAKDGDVKLSTGGLKNISAQMSCLNLLNHKK